MVGISCTAVNFIGKRRFVFVCPGTLCPWSKSWHARVSCAEDVINSFPIVFIIVTSRLTYICSVWIKPWWMHFYNFFVSSFYVYVSKQGVFTGRKIKNKLICIAVKVSTDYCSASPRFQLCNSLCKNGFLPVAPDFACFFSSRFGLPVIYKKSNFASVNICTDFN